MRVPTDAMETQDKNSFLLYGWGTYVAAKNGINNESVAMETNRCVVFFVAANSAKKSLVFHVECQILLPDF